MLVMMFGRISASKKNEEECILLFQHESSSEANILNAFGAPFRKSAAVHAFNVLHGG
jgi:hypothetical protein